MMMIFCWDESVNDGSYGGNASAAIIAPSVEVARDLLRREWDAYLTANPFAVRTRWDGTTYGDETSDADDAPPFYGVRSPRCYARGFVSGIATVEPSRAVPLPDGVPSQVVLLHKGYEG